MVEVNKGNQACIFQEAPDLDSNYYRQSGDVGVLMGDLYESAVVNLFDRDINADIYTFIMQKHEIYYQDRQRKAKEKDIDCYFITKRQLDLKRHCEISGLHLKSYT